VSTAHHEIAWFARSTGILGWMATGLRQGWRAVVDHLVRAPGTYALFFAVLVTTLVLEGLDATTVTRILQQQSTNLLQMSRDAPRVLFVSAFLLDPANLWKQLLLFTVVLAPVERWIGTLRWAAVFVAGHVGATVATTVAIWLQVRSGVGSGELAYAVDVGTSYGVAGAAGVLVFRLPRSLSVLAAGTFLAFAGAAVLRTGTFTDWGHLCAFVIGLAMAPLVRPTRGRAVDPGPSAVRGWWAWLATPPRPTAPLRRRRLARVGGGLLLAAAALVLVVALGADTDVVLQPPSSTLAATVLGPSTGCGRGCDEVLVRLAAGTARLRLPAGTSAPAGRRLDVRRVDGRAGEVRLVGVAHRVSVSGLLGEVAVGAAGVGLVLLLTVGRTARRSPSHP
jgi:hypothetical protein